MCIGICVLLAIVYVLSRTGVDHQEALLQQQQAQLHNGLRYSDINAAIPTTTTTTPSVNNYNTSPNGSDTVSSVTMASPPSAYTPPTESSTTSMSGSIAAANPQEGEEETACDCTSTSTITTSTPPNNVDSIMIDKDNSVELMGKLRQQALANTPPHIIECAAAERGESQAACHLPKRQRFAALGQKGATLWMTGCSGSGKTTIATALEDMLVQQYGKHVYRLDGDNLRTGLNRDLGFSEWDRAESVRRTGELATLFSDAGVITLVGLISPYRKDRDEVRKRHEDQGIPFYEVFLDVPIEELFARDPKGQYERVKSGELKHFTCIDDPYEEPLHPEIVLKTHQCKQIQDSLLDPSIDSCFIFLTCHFLSLPNNCSFSISLLQCKLKNRSISCSVVWNETVFSWVHPRWHHLDCPIPMVISWWICMSPLINVRSNKQKPKPCPRYS
jgi:adenylylsulfate kinase